MDLHDPPEVDPAPARSSPATARRPATSSVAEPGSRGVRSAWWRRAADDATGPVTGPVLVIDGDQLVGWVVAASLRAAGERAQYLPVRSVTEPLRGIDGAEPGIVLLELDLGRDSRGDRIDGTGLIRPLRAAGWRVIVMTGTSTAVGLGAAMAAGGFTCVPKSEPFASLLAAIRLARIGRSLLPDAQRQQLIALHRNRQLRNRARTTKLGSLTVREREVLTLLASGHRARQIADRFVVSEATVRTQIQIGRAHV